MTNRKLHTDERRTSPRIAYRTTGVAVTRRDPEDPNSLAAIRIWTENFGVGGALIISREAILEKQILIKLLLPQLGSTIVECTIIHSGVKEQNGPLSPIGAYWFGLKFGRRVTEENLSADVLACLNGNVASKTPSDPGFQVDPKISSESFRLPEVPLNSNASLKVAAKTACEIRIPEPDQVEPLSVRKRDQNETMIPFLSAIGLAVVYANFLFA